MRSSESSVSTLREKVAASLEEQISRGVYAPGEKLPSLSQVCEQYGVSNITARAVFKLLEERGFAQSRARSGHFVRARSANLALLEENSSEKKTLAFVTLAVGTPFFSALIGGAESAAGAAGYRLVVVNTRGDGELENQALSELAQEVAGLCIVPSQPSVRPYLPLLDAQTPFVFVDRCVDGLAAPFVATDNEEAGFLLTRHLLEVGCRRVWALCDFDGVASSQRDRIRGFVRALKAAGLPFDSSCTLYSPAGLEGAGYQLTRALIEREGWAGNNWRDGEKFGLFCLDEHVAGGAYLALREASLKIPTQVAVAAIGSFLAPHLDPPLSSVGQDLELMGARAIEMLLERIRLGTYARGEEVLLAPRLTIRNSTDSGSAFCRVTQILTDPAYQGLTPAPRAVLSS